MKKFSMLLIFAILLTACGGGGGESNPKVNNNGDFYDSGKGIADISNTEDEIISKYGKWNARIVDHSEKELGNFYIIYRYEDFQIKLSGLKDGSIFYAEQELE